MIQTVLWRSLRETARELHRLGFAHRGATEITLRDDRRVVALRDSARLNDLRPEDLVLSPLFRRGSPEDRQASSLPLHRRLYESTHHKAVIAACPPHVGVCCYGEMNAINGERHLPMDNDVGRTVSEPDTPEVPVRSYRHGARPHFPFPVLDPVPECPILAARELGPHLRRRSVAIVRGGMTYAAGQDLQSCLRLLIALEGFCKPLCGPDHPSAPRDQGPPRPAPPTCDPSYQP